MWTSGERVFQAEGGMTSAETLGGSLPDTLEKEEGDQFGWNRVTTGQSR